MPISTSRICNRTLAAARQGFTLLEVLVVLTLAAILTSVVVLGFTGAATGQALEGETERVMLRMDLARQRALQRNRELGMYVAPDGYRFTELDRQTGDWLPLEQRPFKEIILEPRFRLSIEVDGEAQAEQRTATSRGPGANAGADNDDDGPLPDLVFFRSGEVTPFVLTVETEDQRRGWHVSSDGLSGISMARVE